MRREGVGERAEPLRGYRLDRRPSLVNCGKNWMILRFEVVAFLEIDELVKQHTF